MGRSVKDSKLDTREARRKLLARHEPYWRLIHEGMHLGYRKGPRGGAWTARQFFKGKYHKKALGTADDVSNADGADILSYRQAQEAAQSWGASLRLPERTAPHTVSGAIADYLEWYQANKKAFKASKHSADLHIVPKLGATLIHELTTKQIRKWHENLANSAARARSPKFSKKKNLREKTDPRARRATANRVLTILKAALNHAWRDGKVPTDDAWRKVRPFHNVDAPRIRFLNQEENRRLINACTEDFRQLVHGALLTGARYGELARMVAADFHADSRTLLVSESKSGKSRNIPLTDEGVLLFERLTVTKARNDLIFTRADGAAWGNAHQQRPLAAACATADINPAISFHVLRHSYGAALAMKGVPLQVIAEALGHSDTRITERHYAHVSPSYVADTIRANLPVLGIESDNVARLKKKSTATR